MLHHETMMLLMEPFGNLKHLRMHFIPSPAWQLSQSWMSSMQYLSRRRRHFCLISTSHLTRTHPTPHTPHGIQNECRLNAAWAANVRIRCGKVKCKLTGRWNLLSMEDTEIYRQLSCTPKYSKARLLNAIF